MIAMLRPALLLFAAASTAAAGDLRDSLALRAQAEFDRVTLAPSPRLDDAAACVQSQAAALAAAAPGDAALIHFRKGYCLLAGALISGPAKEFENAAAEFDAVFDWWPTRSRGAAGKRAPEPIPAGLRVLAAVSRLKAGGDDTMLARARAQILLALDAPACAPDLLPKDSCRHLLGTGRQWLGWIALRQGRLEEAAHEFAGLPDSGWAAWVAGRQAFRDRHYEESAALYSRAAETWKRDRANPAPAMAARLAPVPDAINVQEDLGGAQFLAGNAAAAIQSLDAAVAADPSSAWALFLRARAREKAGQTKQSLDDYNLASRTAMAGAKDQATGQAHLYRGILLYRRGDLSRAEDEFSSALNLEIPVGQRPDAEAWRHLSAVAAGSCGASGQSLRRSLSAASPYFPRDEALSALDRCGARGLAESTPGGTGSK